MVGSKMRKDVQMRASWRKRASLVDLLGTECLKELLKAKLIECGWKDTVEGTPLRDNEKKGLQHVTVDDWVAEITPKGRTQVPDCVKEELLGK
ncbi:transcription and mRNA export factor ENY2-like [Dama dama]|uniref:transcription and mRNA export factor ENY2-like n=1 Tax=Dama dama TaxID=30532 RepID=UPI002A371D2A|nr:transcription and mRNA export factor ENY2-like [Dama dama]